VILKIQYKFLKGKKSVEDVVTLGPMAQAHTTSIKEEEVMEESAPKDPTEFSGERPDYVTECAFKSYSK
jgi:hypothetical protein